MFLYALYGLKKGRFGLCRKGGGLNIKIEWTLTDCFLKSKKRIIYFIIFYKLAN